MKPEMIELLKDLADVLEKHSAGLSYTSMDDGIHVSIGDEWNERGICIGWPENGNVSGIRRILHANAPIADGEREAI